MDAITYPMAFWHYSLSHISNSWTTAYPAHLRTPQEVVSVRCRKVVLSGIDRGKVAGRSVTVNVHPMTDVARETSPLFVGARGHSGHSAILSWRGSIYHRK